ncbi:hypothetical protein V1477_010073, partial [Vespula maculifrons]
MYTSTGAICVLEMAVKAKEMWHSRGLEEESWVVVRDVLACKSVDKVEKNSLEFETHSVTRYDVPPYEKRNLEIGCLRVLLGIESRYQNDSETKCGIEECAGKRERENERIYKPELFLRLPLWLHERDDVRQEGL